MNLWQIILIAYISIAYILGILIVCFGREKDESVLSKENLLLFISMPLAPFGIAWILLESYISKTKFGVYMDKRITWMKFHFFNLFRKHDPYRFPKNTDSISDTEVYGKWNIHESVKVNSYLGPRGNKIKFEGCYVFYIALNEHPIEQHIAEYEESINNLLKLSHKKLYFLPSQLKKLYAEDMEYITGCSDIPVKTAYEYYKNAFCDEFKAIFSIPCFICVGRYHGELCIKYVRITDCDTSDPVEIIKKCCYALTRREIYYEPDYPVEEDHQLLYRTRDIDDEEQPELQEEDLKAIEEIKQHIARLIEHGVNHKFLMSLLKEDVKKSRLTITQDFRIFLSDYDNKEIIMPNLAKAIYLMFLNHPEGIPQKEMVDYEDELCELYLKINPGNIARMRASVHRLVDPTRNRMNEELSRIKSYFLAHICEEQADSYIIKGTRGEARSISLDRSLVAWE